MKSIILNKSHSFQVIRCYSVKGEMHHCFLSLCFPPEDGYVRMFLRGRPVTMHIPDQQRETYSLDHKVAQPDQKLKLQWVYPLD